MCFETNGLKTLKLTILRFLTQPPTPLTYTTLIAVSHLLSINLHEFT